MTSRSIIDRLTGKGFKVFSRKGAVYALLEGPLTWRAARQKARKLGGDLITINGPGENRFITSRFGPLAADPCGLWIGLNAVGSPGQFRWSNGEEDGYRHWVPGGVPGYPQGMPSADPSRKYVHIYFNPNAKGYWKNSDNTYHDVVLGGGIAEFQL